MQQDRKGKPRRQHRSGLGRNAPGGGARRWWFLAATLLGVGAAGVFLCALLWRPGGEESGKQVADGERPPLRKKSPEDLATLLPNASSGLPATSREVTEEANHLVDWLVARFPDDPDSYEVMARVRFWLGDSEAAVKCWEKCVELSPAYAYAYHGMGLVAAKKGEHEQAVDLFRKVLEFAPNAEGPQSDLANALLTLGRMEEAAALLEKHVRTARDPAPGLILLGKAYLNLNKIPQAKASYEAAARLQPNSGDARFGLATACSRLGQSQEAKEQMTKFKELMAKEKEVRKAERSRPDDVEAMRRGLAATYRIVSRICGLAGAPREAERFARRAETLSNESLPSLPALPAPEDTRSRRMKR